MNLQWLMAGLLAVSVVWVIHRVLAQLAGNRLVMALAPLTEEAFKTGLAMMLTAPLILTHLTFGVAEAALDYLIQRSWRGAVVSLCGHGAFGAVTQALFMLSGHWWLGLVAAVMLHWGWNALVIRLAPRATKS